VKICFTFNHLSCSDGVARAAIGIANLLNREGHEITICPIFRCDKEAEALLRQGIKVQPVFRCYFQGMSRLINILPRKLLHKMIFRDTYDYEVAFQFGISTKIVGNSKTNAKHYCWMHGYDTSMALRNYYLKMDKLICVSKCNAERLKRDLDTPLKIDFCYNPIDERFICKLGQEAIKLQRGSETVFVSVGRHSWEKGYARLLDCVRRLKYEGYTFKLWLIGDGPEHKNLMNKSNELGLNDFVAFIGATSNPHAYTAKADLFVCSSYSEGYSTACTEAILLNVPVISTLVSGAKEIICDAEAGMLVENIDEALYQGMKRILDHPELIQEWRNKLKETKKRFSYDERAHKLLSLFPETATAKE